jgi:hypothetical protein
VTREGQAYILDVDESCATTVSVTDTFFLGVGLASLRRCRMPADACLRPTRMIIIIHHSQSQYAVLQVLTH